MSYTATKILSRFEALVKQGRIESFNVSIREGGLLVKSDDGKKEQQVDLENETYASVEAFFHGIEAIEHDSFDYTSLKSLINAKDIIDRMLHNKNLQE